MSSDHEQNGGPDEIFYEQVGLTARQIKFWKKLAWEFEWEFAAEKIADKRWVFIASRTIEGKRRSFRCTRMSEISPWYMLQIKIPALREQAEMRRIFDDLDSAPKEMPEEPFD